MLSAVVAKAALATATAVSGEACCGASCCRDSATGVAVEAVAVAGAHRVALGAAAREALVASEAVTSAVAAVHRNGNMIASL